MVCLMHHSLQLIIANSHNTLKCTIVLIKYLSGLQRIPVLSKLACVNPKIYLMNITYNSDVLGENQI